MNKLTVVLVAPRVLVPEIVFTGWSFACIPETTTGTLTLNYEVTRCSGNYGLQVFTNGAWQSNEFFTGPQNGSGTFDLIVNTGNVGGDYLLRIADTTLDIYSNELTVEITSCSSGNTKIDITELTAECSGVSVRFKFTMTALECSGDFAIDAFFNAQWNVVATFPSENGIDLKKTIYGNSFIETDGEQSIQYRVRDTGTDVLSNTNTALTTACPLASIFLSAINLSIVDFTADNIYSLNGDGELLLDELDEFGSWNQAGKFNLHTEPFSGTISTGFEYTCIDDKQYRLRCANSVGGLIVSNTILYDTPTSVTIASIVSTETYAVVYVVFTNAYEYPGLLEAEVQYWNGMAWQAFTLLAIPSSPYTGMQGGYNLSFADQVIYRIAVKDQVGNMVYSSEETYSSSFGRITQMLPQASGITTELINAYGVNTIDGNLIYLQQSDNGVDNFTTVAQDILMPAYTGTGNGFFVAYLPTDGKYYRLYFANSSSLPYASEAYQYIQASDIKLSSLYYTQIPNNDCAISFKATKITEVQNAQGTRRICLQKSVDGVNVWMNIMDWLGDYLVEFPDNPVPYTGDYTDTIGIQPEENMYYRLAAGDYAYSALYSDVKQYKEVHSVVLTNEQFNVFCDVLDLNVGFMVGTFVGDSYYAAFDVEIWNGASWVIFQVDGGATDVTVQGEAGVIAGVQFILPAVYQGTTQQFRLRSRGADTSILSNEVSITFSTCP